MDLTGSTIRNIHIEEMIAAGGMGEVYLAHDRGLQRDVAVKAIRGGRRLHDKARARFLREARTLSMLEHTNICRVYDLIQTDDADLLVLELLRGQTLTQALREGLTKRQKLDVGIQVADALVAAHSMSVVHRDIKPDNIMCTPENVVKILDFGIARLLPETEDATSGTVVPFMTAEDRSDTAIQVLTERGALVGTIRYMSPEQALGEPATAASDIYAFGLLLQEMFTGRSPYPEGLNRTQLIARVTWADTEEVVGVDGSLATLIKSMTSLSPTDRPGAVDVARRLRLIQDRPRRRFKKIAVGGIALSLMLAVVGSTLGLVRARRAERQAREETRRANREAATATRVSDFLVGLFEVSDPYNPVPAGELRGQTITAREILDRGADRLERSLEDEPLIRAQLSDTVGRVYISLGLLDRADSLIEKALADRIELLGEDHPVVAESLESQAYLRTTQGKYEEAETRYRRALEIRRRTFGADHESVRESLRQLAFTLRIAGDLEQSETLFREVVRAERSAAGDRDATAIKTLEGLAAVLRDRGDYDEAESLLREALDLARETFGDHPEVGVVMETLARVLAAKGERDEAEEMYRSALAISVDQTGEGGEQAATIRIGLASLIAQKCRYEEAEALLRHALASYREVLGPEHPYVGTALSNLARVLHLRGLLEDAEAMYLESLEIKRLELGPTHKGVVQAMSNLGVLLTDRADYAQAEPLLREVLEIRRDQFGEHRDVASSLNLLAKLLLATGRIDEAETSVAEALAMRRKILGERHVHVAIALTTMARVHVARGRFAAARVAVDEALGIFAETLPDGHWQTASAEAVLAACLLAENRLDEAEDLLLAGQPVIRDKRGERSFEHRRALRTLVGLYQAIRNDAKAELYAELLERAS